jgi:hypothetical protein
MPENNFFLVFPTTGIHPNIISPHIKKQDTTPSQQNREVPIISFPEIVNGTYLTPNERIFRILTSGGPIWTITEQESENLQ